MLTYFTLGTCHCLSKTWQRKKRTACVAHLAWCRNIRLRLVSKCPTLSCCQPWLATNTQVCLQTYIFTIKEFFIKGVFYYKTHNQDLSDCSDPSAAHRIMVSLFIYRSASNTQGEVQGPWRALWQLKKALAIGQYFRKSNNLLIVQNREAMVEDQIF